MNFADAIILFFQHFYRNRNKVDIVNSSGHNNRIVKISYHNSPIYRTSRSDCLPNYSVSNYVILLIPSKQGHCASSWFELQAEAECCRGILQSAREAQTHVSQSSECCGSHCRHHIFTSSSRHTLTSAHITRYRNQARGHHSAPFHFLMYPTCLRSLCALDRDRTRVTR